MGNLIKRVKMKFSVAAAMLVAAISATEAESEQFARSG